MNNPFCECGNYKTSNTQFCESCNRAMRKEAESIKKGTEKLKKMLSYRVKKSSNKRARQESKYLKERVPYLEKRPFCKVEGCRKLSNQVHHKAGRIGYLLLFQEWWLAVCETCHEKIELNPEWAKAKGYSINRLSIKTLK